MYNPVPVILIDDIADTISIIYNLLNLTGNFKASLNYVRDMQDKYETSSFELAAFRVLEVALTLLKRYGYLFDDSSTKKVFENDYLRLVWSPILEALFPPDRFYSHYKSKKNQYPYHKNVIGFKIDIRLVLDDDGKMVDLCVGKLGRQPDDKKAISDEGKLMREGKETIDGLIRLINDNNFQFHSYTMQFTGCSCVLSKVDLGANVLYIATHVHSFELPSCINDFSNMKEVIAKLLTIKKDLLVTVDRLKKRKSSVVGTPGSLNREDRRHSNGKLDWVRDTFHTPTPETMPKVPAHLYVRPSTLEYIFRYH